MAATPQKLLECLDADEDKGLVFVGHRKEGGREDLNSYTIFRRLPLDVREAMVEEAVKDSSLDRAMGSICGMAVGDTMGHPFEFMPVQSEVRPESPHFDLETMTFHKESNAFRLKRGQWTDDASMGLCMADSLILRRGFDGGDMRVRFWCWWERGYNNAFRKDSSRSHSVGLGGNISTSLAETFSLRNQTMPEAVATKGEDAGNGSLMRFAPVAVFMHSQTLQEVHDVSRRSSYTTHPGIIAAEACAFLGHLIASAMRLPAGEAVSAQAFLDREAAEYLRVSGLDGKSGWGFDQMKWLVTSSPVNNTEKCWNWRAKTLDIKGTLKARGRSYNGYPVSAGYFGSYALDGLALALWAVYNTSSFDEAVVCSINLLGDSDSHGSIAGQLAGAIYGYRAINPQFMRWVNEWDDHEFALRAILLHHLGSRQEGEEKEPKKSRSSGP